LSPAQPTILLKVEDIFAISIDFRHVLVKNYFALGVNTSHIYLFTYMKLLKCKTALGNLVGWTLETAGLVY